MRKRESPLRRYSLAADPVSETAECLESQTLRPFRCQGIGGKPSPRGSGRLRPGVARGEQLFVLAECVHGKGNEEPEAKRGAEIRT